MLDRSISAASLQEIGGSQSPLAPDAIRGRLGVLIRRYLREGSPGLARSVVAHLEALCQDPELRDADLFCAYCRLVRHWRWLAAQPDAAGGVSRPAADQV
jgi:hypothetical protein